MTEAGFAFDLGGEKFFDLKCRSAGLNPAAVVIVATIRALKMHGGVPLDATKEPNPAAVERGLENLAAHLDSAAHFGKPIVVAINQFAADTAEELRRGPRVLRGRGVPCATANVFGEGGRGATELAEKVVAAAVGARDAAGRPLYPARLARRAEDRARSPGSMYGAAGVNIQQAAESKLRKASKLGYGELPDLHGQDAGLALRQPQAPRPAAGASRSHVRDVEIAAGAGLPRRPHRRDRADARPPRAPRRRADRRRRRGEHHRALLIEFA